jgi:NitT/TauT family transport system ATP-binding protein
MNVAGLNVSVSYRTPGGGLLPALGPITFRIETGEFVCLVGPSGCGKSTLIRLLAGLQKPTQGQILLDDAILTTPSSRVGLMFQDTNLMPWRSVLDNIALPLEIAGVHRHERYEAVRAMLPTLGLAEFEGAYPGELSGGMAQRAALGRVLLQRPDLLLLDEPFGALDALTREQISLDLLRLWSEQRQTAVMVTHSIPEAVLLADRVLVFTPRPGRLTADIPILLERPRRLEMIYTESFNALARQVREAVERSQEN